ncbi:MAG: class I adenylate-forming enzyme family protein [Acidimicrobiales bacterium]|jgi:acyl-CoA synthetase (AMP-forming)/AMP-acid ligase II|nr:class I adenylate-forming enzyme family protein [Acidimicrobiales bacterium]MDP6900742.1 class I adenylate-forming enzyme family protein [Acidimicrobiales bacterium]
MNVAELLDQTPDPESIALVDRSKEPAERLTVTQIQNQVRVFAAALVNRGLAPGSRVGMLASNLSEYYIVMFGAPAAGMVFVPLNTRLPASTLEYIASDAKIELLVTDAGHAASLASVPSIVIGSTEWTEIMAGVPLDDLAEVEPGDVAIQIYTSGSTGQPKGVLLSHENVTFTVLEYGAALPGEVMLVSAPLYHKNASMASKLAFASGGQVVLLPQFSARGYLEAINDHRVSMCSGVPTMYALITAELHESPVTYDLSSVQRVLIGSAPMTEALFDDVQALFPDAHVTNGYGTTEAVLEFGPHPDGLPRPKIALGYQHPKVELKLVDPENGAESNHGELWVRSKGVMKGYHDLPAANAERLTDGWYHTGDLMSRDDDGWYFFVGRVDDMFVCAGENIYPDSVEQMLEQHEAVHQAVVVPVADDLKGQLPTAFVRIESGAQLNAEELKRFALEHGPPYAHPRHVWFVDEIPLASTAKVDRAALTKQAEELVTPDRDVQ